MSKKYDEKVVEFIRINYPLFGAKYCANELGEGYNSQGILLYCRKNNIPSMGRDFDLSDFTTPTKKEIAYFLGLVWGDGHISKGERDMCINVVRDDGEFFLETIQGIGPFRVYHKYSKDRKPQVSIHLIHREIVKFLVAMDYKEKSLVDPSKIINLLDESLHRFFWLGFFDADGCCYRGGKDLVRISFSGSYEQDWESLTKFLDKVGCKWRFQRDIAKNGNKSSRIEICSKFDVLLLGKTFYKTYDEDKIGLPRKRDKLLEVEANRRSKRKNSLGYTGVRATANGYRYAITRNGVWFSEAGFSSAEDAAIAYDKRAVEASGHRANTNFPIENYIVPSLVSEDLV